MNTSMAFYDNYTTRNYERSYQEENYEVFDEKVLDNYDEFFAEVVGQIYDTMCHWDFLIEVEKDGVMLNVEGSLYVDVLKRDRTGIVSARRWVEVTDCYFYDEEEGDILFHDEAEKMKTEIENFDYDFED